MAKFLMNSMVNNISSKPLVTHFIDADLFTLPKYGVVGSQNILLIRPIYNTIAVQKLGVQSCND